MSLFSFISAKAAAGVLAVVALGAGGTAAAAYTSSLPDPARQSAHGAEPSPSAAASPSPSASRVGPDAAGPAAFGLCQAFTHGGLDAKSTAYASLARAAKGASNIASYCAGVAHPGASASHGAAAQHSAPSKSAKPRGDKPDDDGAGD